MQRSLFCLCLCLCWLLAVPAWTGVMTVTELRQIAQAGGSLVLDLDEHTYTVTELVSIARVLQHGATLTVKMNDRQRLPLVQCLQVVKARPGQVRFWLGR